MPSVTTDYNATFGRLYICCLTMHATAALAGAKGDDGAELGRKRSSRSLNLPDGGGQPGIQLPEAESVSG